MITSIVLSHAELYDSTLMLPYPPAAQATFIRKLFHNSAFDEDDAVRSKKEE